MSMHHLRNFNQKQETRRERYTKIYINFKINLSSHTAHKHQKCKIELRKEKKKGIEAEFDVNVWNEIPL